MKLAVATAAVLLLALPAAQSAATPASSAADCTRTSTGLVALTDLRAQRYKGYRGGLYPGGSNGPSKRYLAAGVAAGKRVTPRTADGEPAPTGRVVLLSIGMSNATQEFSAFLRLAATDPQRNPRLTIVDGAQGGQDAVRIGNAAAPYWAEVDRRLRAAGSTAQQVQAVWLKQAIARESLPFPQDAKRLRSHLRSIVEILDGRFPNLQLVYLSSRTYAGYATTRLNPEPHAYHSGFAVKWTIQDRIERKLTGPWIGWGPYLWTDGTRGRRDGLTWTCADLAPDGTHPSQAGREKVGAMLLRFFRSDATSRGWFRG